MQWSRPIRVLRARPLFTTAYGVGLTSFFLLTPLQPVALRAVAAWDAGSFLFILLSFVIFARLEHNISATAKRQQEGEWTVFTLTLLGAMMSFAAIFLFSQAAERKAHAAFYLGFVAVTLVLSWATTNLVFAYRYAHEYYSYGLGGKTVDGGIVFPADERPDYFDFVYFAFCLGMTFQVSDCNITSKKLRRLATLQGLIGFLFNTVILALSVNIAASLL